MTSAPRARPELLVIEGGRSCAGGPGCKAALPDPDVAQGNVVNLAGARSRMRPEAAPDRPGETAANWALGAAAFGIFLTGLGLWTFGANWAGHYVILP